MYFNGDLLFHSCHAYKAGSLCLPTFIGRSPLHARFLEYPITPSLGCRLTDLLHTTPVTGSDNVSREIIYNIAPQDENGAAAM